MARVRNVANKSRKNSRQRKESYYWINKLLKMKQQKIAETETTHKKLKHYSGYRDHSFVSSSFVYCNHTVNVISLGAQKFAFKSFPSSFKLKRNKKSVIDI